MERLPPENRKVQFSDQHRVRQNRAWKPIVAAFGLWDTGHHSDRRVLQGLTEVVA